MIYILRSLQTKDVIVWIWWQTYAGSQRDELRPWQRSWGRRLQHTQRQDRASGNPLFPSIYPQNQSLPTLLFYALTYTSDFTGGCTPLPLSEKELTYSSKSIKIPGCNKGVSTYKLLWRLSSLPVQVHPATCDCLQPPNLMRCFRLTKSKLFWEVRNYWYSGLVRNYIGEEFFICCANNCY